jgi:hypothetical protein
MARFVCAVLLLLALLAPATASAAEFSFNIAVSRQDDGTTTGELWYNDRVVWRIKLASDDAQPVSGPSASGTMVVAPEVESGMFLLKVYNQ